MSLCRSAATAALIGAAVTFAPTATAVPDAPSPVPAPPPAPAGLIPTLTAIGTVMGQTGSEPTGPLGLPDLSAYAPNLLLGQNPVPAAPGEPSPPAIPSLNAFNPDFLVPLNSDPAPPDAGEPAPGIGPNEENPGTGRIAFLRRINEMYQAGLLEGALLGQRPPEEFPPPAAPPG